MLRKHIPIVLGCLIALASGCDTGSFEPEVSSSSPLLLDLSALVGQSESCRTVVSSVTLFADGQRVDSSSIAVDGRAVFESVSLLPGIVGFEARVFGNAGPLVFLGRTRQLVPADGFGVEIRPAAVRPVMEVCIPEGEQSVVINNRGIDAVDWEIKTPTDVACPAASELGLVLDRCSGVTATSETITYAVNTSEPRTFDLSFESPEGRIGVRIVSVSGSAAAGKMSFYAP